MRRYIFAEYESKDEGATRHLHIIGIQGARLMALPVLMLCRLYPGSHVCHLC